MSVIWTRFKGSSWLHGNDFWETRWRLKTPHGAFDYYHAYNSFFVFLNGIKNSLELSRYSFFYPPSDAYRMALTCLQEETEFFLPIYEKSFAQLQNSPWLEEPEGRFKYAEKAVLEQRPGRSFKTPQGQQVNEKDVSFRMGLHGLITETIDASLFDEAKFLTKCEQTWTDFRTNLLSFHQDLLLAGPPPAKDDHPIEEEFYTNGWGLHE